MKMGEKGAHFIFDKKGLIYTNVKKRERFNGALKTCVSKSLLKLFILVCEG
jgi:hypothetical protein